MIIRARWDIVQYILKYRYKECNLSFLLVITLHCSVQDSNGAKATRAAARQQHNRLDPEHDEEKLGSEIGINMMDSNADPKSISMEIDVSRFSLQPFLRLLIKTCLKVWKKGFCFHYSKAKYQLKSADMSDCSRPENYNVDISNAECAWLDFAVGRGFRQTCDNRVQLNRTRSEWSWHAHTT